MRIRQRRSSAAMLLLGAAAAIAAGGCGNDPVSPTSPALPGQRTSSTAGGSGAGSFLGEAALEAMNAGIQDEFHAEFTYLKVLQQFGDVQPFYNILYAEQRHSAAIATLFENYGLPVPGSRWTLDNVPVFGSLSEACAGGVAAELENIALYDKLLTLDLPQDVRNVFTNVRAASLENHLPAFQTCCVCGR